MGRPRADCPDEVLEPRATLADTPDGLEARLLVGPFTTLDDAEAICGQLALPAGIACRPVGFAGEVIARHRSR